MKVVEMLKIFIKDEQGTETVEWAIMIGVIAVAAIAIIMSIGQWVLAQFTDLNTALQAS